MTIEMVYRETEYDYLLWKMILLIHSDLVGKQGRDSRHFGIYALGYIVPTTQNAGSPLGYGLILK